MQKLQNTFSELWAAMIFFTRLPLWRIYQPNAECYRHVVKYWPITGWLTAGSMLLTFEVCNKIMPLSIAILFAIGARILLTGALHEDGLADFCDAMGGGCDREKTLAIMKDSHIGTFGVVALIFYFLFFGHALISLSAYHYAFIILLADIWGKCVASLLIFQLPYARSAEEAKNKTVYLRYSFPHQIIRIGIAMIPVIVLWINYFEWYQLSLIVSPLIVELILAQWIKLRLKGYTGDCCGAVFLISEISIYLTALIIYYNS